MIAAPRVKYVRGESMFGYSFVNVVFADGTDLYWARSRVLEYMQGITGRLPEGVAPRLGPDATGVGWVYEYALVDRSGTHTLADLRSFQDWTLRYWLAGVEGVAEVASVGGFVKQYQVEIDPATLLAHRLPLREVIDAIRRSNNEVGGRLVEFSGTEYIVRGRGYVQSIADLEQIAVGSNGRGTPILVRDIGRVHLGPDLRRGLAELDGQGEAVGGVVVMRHGQNALRVIDGVKEKLRSIAPSLPPGVEIVPVYDRSTLIERAIDTLRHTLVEELLIVSGVILLFLWHLRARSSRSSPSRSPCCSPSSPCARWGSRPTSCRSAASRSRSAPWSTRPSWWSSRRTRSSSAGRRRDGPGTSGMSSSRP